MPLLLNDPVRAQVLGPSRLTWPSTADLKSRHRGGGEGPLASSTTRPGLALRVSRPIAGGFSAFLAWEQGRTLWGNPGAGVKFSRKGLRDLYPLAISNVPDTAAGVAGRLLLTVPSSSCCAAAPGAGVGTGDQSPRGTAAGHRCPCLG